MTRGLKMKLVSLIVGSLIFLSSTISESFADTGIQLKAASFLPARSVYAKYFYRWVDEVNDHCTGKMNIKIVGPEAVRSMEQWRTLKDGVIDIHYGPPNYYKGVLIEGDVTVLANTSAAEQRKNGAWEIINALHNEKLNAWYLTHIVDGVPFFIYTVKPTNNGRFDGFRLRSTPIYDEFFRRLGAEPVRMPPPSLYTALERNTVDGYGWPLWGITDLGWDRHTKYRHGPGFFSAVINILVNLDRWNSLKENQRRCLTDMAIWLEHHFPAWRTTENENQVAAQTSAGITYVDLGPNFPVLAHEIHWNVLMGANPTAIGALRPLLVQ